MKKFFTLIIAALLLIAAPTQAEDLGVELEDISAAEFSIRPSKNFTPRCPKLRTTARSFDSSKSVGGE